MCAYFILLVSSFDSVFPIFRSEVSFQIDAKEESKNSCKQTTQTQICFDQSFKRVVTRSLVKFYYFQEFKVNTKTIFFFIVARLYYYNYRHVAIFGINRHI